MARSFFERDPVTVARALLGQRLVRVLDGQRLSGVIVETEAYLGVEDKAAHTFGGRRTARNASMWLTGGHAYVYFTYGMHYCLNVVAGREGEPVAVLVRAIEPVEGLNVMRSLRVARRRTGAKLADRELASGPARLCQAMGIDRGLDGVDLTRGNGMFIEQVRKRTLPAGAIAVGPRIGVDYAGEWAKKPLRFWVRGNGHVSK